MLRRQFLKLLATLPLIKMFGWSPLEERRNGLDVQRWRQQIDAGPTENDECFILVMGNSKEIWVTDNGDDRSDGLTLETAKRTLAAALGEVEICRH